MLNEKLIAILETLNGKEWIELRKYLDSTKGSDSQLVKIFNVLERNRTKLRSSNLTLEKLFQKLGSDSQSLPRFQNQIYRLREVVEDFITREALFQNKGKLNLHYEQLLVASLRERDLYQLLSERTTSFQKKLDKRPQDRYSHFYQLLVSDLSYFQDNNDKLLKKKSRRDSTIKKAMKELDLFYYALKLRYGAELLSRNRIIDEDNFISDIEQLISESTSKSLDLTEYHHLFTAAFKMIQSEDKKDYHNLKTQFLDQHQHLQLEEQQTLLSYLINFCIQRVQANEIEFLEEVLFLYEHGLSEQLFLDGNTLSATRLCNIIDATAKLGKFTKAQEILDTYGKKLSSESRKETLAIATATINFEAGNYDDVITGLRSFKRFKLPSNELRARWLQICCHYELEDEVLLENLLINTEAFLRRSPNLGRQHVRGSLNFIKFVKWLSIPKYDNKRKDKKTLATELADFDYIFYKTWLSKKLDELQESPP